MLLAGDTISGIIERASAEGSLAALRRFKRFWSKILRDSDFNARCPVVSVAVGGSADEQHL